MAGSKIKLKDQLGRVVRVGGEVAPGATVGRDLRWPDGTIVKLSEIKNPAVDSSTGGMAPTLWKLIREIPSNIQKLAKLAGVGFTTRDADGEWYQRTIEAGEGIEVENADGGAGNPAVALRVSSGSAYIQSLDYVLDVSAAVTKSGLSLSASGWHHVFLYPNGGGADIEIVATAPDSPYIGSARSKVGDASRRYLGSVRTDAAGSIIPFVVDSTGAFRYLIGNNLSPLRCLANGKAISRTTVSLSQAIPVTAIGGMFIMTNTDTGVFANISVSTAASASVVGIAPGGALAGQLLTFPTDSSQAVDYYYSVAPANGLYIDVVGFTIER